MRLLLIRHGQTSSNVGHHLDTAEPGPGLTELGHQQAAALPETLRAEGIEVVYASSLVRTQQTAAPLAASLGLDVQVRRGLREVYAGALEMANDPRSVQTYLSTAIGWADGALHRRMPGADEDGAEVLGRFDEVVEEVAVAGAGVAALVSHGAIIRAWTAARAGNVTPDFAARNVVSNTGVVILTGMPGRWQVEYWQELALGGPALEDAATDGAAAEPVRG
jgi:broad specificity phosphatase PhoE